MAGKDYSTTPLGKKLGAKPGLEVLVFFTTSRKELERCDRRRVAGRPLRLPQGGSPSIASPGP